MTRPLDPQSVAMVAELLAAPINPFQAAAAAAKLPTIESIHEDAEMWAHGAGDEQLATCLVETAADVQALRGLSAETAEMATLMRDLALVLGVEVQR